MSENTDTQHSDEADYQSGLPGPLGLLDKILAKIEAAVLGFGVLLMAFNTISNVIARYLIGESIFFSEEVSRILIIVITFAGVSYAARYGRHIRMSAIFDTLNPRGRKIVMIIITIFTGLVMLLLSWFALQYLLDVKSSGRILPALQIPVWWILLYVPLGLLLTAIQYLLTAYKNITDKDTWLSTQVLEGYDEDTGL